MDEVKNIKSHLINVNETKRMKKCCSNILNILLLMTEKLFFAWLNNYFLLEFELYNVLRPMISGTFVWEPNKTLCENNQSIAIDRDNCDPSKQMSCKFSSFLF